MTDQPLDPELQARLRELADARVRAQIQAAKQRVGQQRDSRAEFARRRRYGLEERHALREARIRLTEHHDQKGQP